MELRVSPLTKIICLSGTLATGFLLVILSCALYHNYYPLLGLMAFLIAPLPGAIFDGKSGDALDFGSDSGHSGRDFGYFMTASLVTTGVVLPMVLYHCQLLGSSSCVMGIAGGAIIYLSIVVFSRFFRMSWEQEDEALFG